MSNLTLELAIWDILSRQLVAGIVGLICFESKGGHRPSSELCWCLRFKFWFSFFTYQYIFSVSGMNYLKKIRSLLYRKHVSFPLNKTVDRLENDSLSKNSCCSCKRVEFSGNTNIQTLGIVSWGSNALLLPPCTLTRVVHTHTKEKSKHTHNHTYE